MSCWILDGMRPVPATLLEWGAWFENIENRRVARDVVGPGILVSTVFLGIDHNFSGSGAPLLFETMAFAPDGYAIGDVGGHWSTWDRAQAEHFRVVLQLRQRSELQ